MHELAESELVLNFFEFSCFRTFVFCGVRLEKRRDHFTLYNAINISNQHIPTIRRLQQAYCQTRKSQKVSPVYVHQPAK